MIVLKTLPDEFTLYQLPKDTKIPMNEVLEFPWYTISKTTSELSLLLPSVIQPSWLAADNQKKNDIKREDGWKALQVDAQMDFALVGILTQIINPLRDHQISVFCISTFDTDYVLVKQLQFDDAVNVLKNQPNLELKSGISVITSE
ncbi:unnamed protein product [Cunninghamella blakesleeana]